MRIGLYMMDDKPETGGGYTFRDELAQSFIDSLGTISGGRHRGAILRNPVIVGPADPTRRIVASLRRAQAALLRCTFGASGSGRRSQIDDMARSAGVQCLWFIDSHFVETDLPYLLTVFDLQHRHQPWFPEVSAEGRWDWREEFYARAIRRAWHIIAGSSEGRDQVHDYFQVSLDRISVVPLPTPGAALKSDAGRGNGVAGLPGLPPRYLFFPAQFWAHKNHVGLLCALRVLKDEFGIALPLVFTGSDHGNKAFVESEVDRLGLRPQVFFCGLVPQAALYSLYRNALALVDVTFFGPDNIPPLEAFALDCPVIVSDLPGARQWIGDGALFVDPTDERAIAVAIKKLHDDSGLRDRLVAAGRQRAGSWRMTDYLGAVSKILDDFEPIRRCWPA